MTNNYHDIKEFVDLTPDKLKIIKDEDVKAMLKSVPVGASFKAISTWEDHAPLRVTEIIFKSPQFFEQKAPQLEFKSIERSYGYQVGQFKKGTSVMHGVGRYIMKHGGIIETIWINGDPMGFGRVYREDGSYKVG